MTTRREGGRHASRAGADNEKVYAINAPILRLPV
jgi:hypothetical protein